MWQRLDALRDDCCQTLLSWTDVEQLRRVAQQQALPAADTASAPALAYHLVRRALTAPDILEQASLTLPAGYSPVEALKAIDALHLSRSQAHYERAFKTPVA